MTMTDKEFYERLADEFEIFKCDGCGLYFHADHLTMFTSDNGEDIYYCENCELKQEEATDISDSYSQEKSNEV